VKREPTALVVVFERESEEPERLIAANGRQALAQAFGLLVSRRELQAGDRLTIKATDSET
jgi:hypothetical protein